jgi:hypothetical protein
LYQCNFKINDIVKRINEGNLVSRCLIENGSVYGCVKV